MGVQLGGQPGAAHAAVDLDERLVGGAALACGAPVETAGMCHQALSVVATTLRLLDAHGADAPVWRRFGRDGWHTLTGGSVPRESYVQVSPVR
ncbi:hypothetical protein [Kitasatospora aureofaciens]|uniref:hypothetical protein n=1 Tax=Kitasatospora aureofaciens TaxID=1894 RepID=UPI0037CB5279